MEGTRKKGVPYKTWRDKVEEDLGIMRNENSQRPETVKNERRLLEAKILSGL
jgi:hypothetical protein